jgi:hypothetical protein
MDKVLNIEVLRMKKTKRTATMLAVCALALAFLVGMLPATHATYKNSDQDSHVFVFSESKDVKVALQEPSWTAFSGIGVTAGTTVAKDPIVKNVKDKGNGCYFRVNLRIVDQDGKTLDPATNSARVNLILQTLWSDPENMIDTTKSYSLSELKLLSGVNQDYNQNKFDALKWNDTMHAWTIDYKGTDGNGVLDGQEEVHVFDKMVIPSDYTNEEITLMGNYYVNMWVQAIQTDGFKRDEALAQLSNENVDNDIEI